LAEAKLEDQPVYLISCKALLNLTSAIKRRIARGTLCLDKKQPVADILKDEEASFSFHEWGRDTD